MLEGHKDIVSPISLSQNDRLFSSVSYDKTVRLFSHDCHCQITTGKSFTDRRDIFVNLPLFITSILQANATRRPAQLESARQLQRGLSMTHEMVVEFIACISIDCFLFQHLCPSLRGTTRTHPLSRCRALPTSSRSGARGFLSTFFTTFPSLRPQWASCC